MSDLPSLPLFVDDFEAATAHLTLEEDGVYNRLLRLCWRTPGCSIPDDRAWVIRRMRCDEETFDRVVAPIIGEFFKRENGRILQKRLRKEFEYVSSVSKRRKQAGKEGARAKALKSAEKDTSKASNLPEAISQQTPSKPQALTLTPTPTYSEANASGATAPPEKISETPPAEIVPLPERKDGSPKPEAIIFAVGVPLLIAAGDSDKSARSYFGKQVKTFGAAAVAKVVTDAVTQRPLEPKSWILAALRCRDGPDDDAWQARIAPDDKWLY